MRNGKEKRDYIEQLINQSCEGEKTISELYAHLRKNLKFKKRVTKGCFHKSIKILIEEGRINSRLDFCKRTGSLRKVFLITKK